MRAIRAADAVARTAARAGPVALGSSSGAAILWGMAAAA